MALLLLKMNNLEGAEVLLSKANSYNSEKLNEAAQNIDKGINYEKIMQKKETELNEKYDKNNLIYKKSLEDVVNSQKSNNVDVFQNADDAAAFEAKFYYLFVSGLYE